jgi:hypothetical protein
MIVHKGLDVPALYQLGQAEAKAAIITLDLMPKDSFELDFYQLHNGNTRSHRTSLGRPHGDWVGVTSLHCATAFSMQSCAESAYQPCADEYC